MSGKKCNRLAYSFPTYLPTSQFQASLQKEEMGEEGRGLLTIHYFVDFGHAGDNFLHADIESFTIIGLACIES